MKTNNENLIESLKLDILILEYRQLLGVKVQSVTLPPNFKRKPIEEDFINWLKNKIQSLHTANYELKLKYAND